MSTSRLDQVQTTRYSPAAATRYGSAMNEAEALSRLRAQLRAARENEVSWERSRRLVSSPEVSQTLKRLSAILAEEGSWPARLRHDLRESLRGGEVARIQDLPASALKRLTGLPATKAVRALCIVLGLMEPSSVAAQEARLSSENIDRVIRSLANPYDLLLTADVASLLDLGAGDLSFVEEIADQYGSSVTARQIPLVLHAVDRLRPGSKLGGPLHVPPRRLKKLSTLPAGVEFRFWGDLDMFAIETNSGLMASYTIVTCHAPATPTFAYEPTRLSSRLITEHLSSTKGQSRAVRVEGESALEVQHGGKALLFPPWKFDIRGPLTLLDLLSRRGKLCVLSSIDTAVFWELLSQLVAAPDVRPPEIVFTAEVIPRIFGPLYTSLMALPVGAELSLADLTPLRQDLPRVLSPGAPETPLPYGFRTVLIRRGATFANMPASLTARLFKEMREEAVPWFMVLVP